MARRPLRADPGSEEGSSRMVEPARRMERTMVVNSITGMNRLVIFIPLVLLTQHLFVHWIPLLRDLRGRLGRQHLWFRLLMTRVKPFRAFVKTSSLTSESFTPVPMRE